jgi:hypothetical protein
MTKVFKLFTNKPDNTTPDYLRGREDAFNHVADLLKEFEFGVSCTELKAVIKMIRSLK